MKFRNKTAAVLVVSMLAGLVNTGPVFGAYEIITEESTLVTDGAVLEETGIEDIGILDDGSLVLSDEEDDLICSDNDDNGGLKRYEGSDEACDSLNTKLNGREMMAVLYLCDEYPLRAFPSVSADTTASLPSGTTLYLKSVSYAEGTYWFYAGAYLTEEEMTGYIPMDKLVSIDRDYLDWEQTLTASYGGEISADGAGAGIPGKARESVYSFPDTYRNSLLKILGSHPNWIFVPQKVDTTLAEAVNAQYADKNRNWVYYTVPDSYKAGKINNTWYYASKTGLNYYMNPANFVGSEKDIFMFEQLTYNASYQTESGVQSVLAGTFMSGNIPGEGKTYAAAFNAIGSKLKVSPYHLAARVYQEQGKGTSPLISGTYPGYEGYYNYFNIQATGSSNSDIYKNGLAYARSQGWDSRYKSLEGGARFDSKNYILAGQDTPYLEKYNVVKKTYWHQYMQNATAPLTEASKVYSMYKSSGALNNPFVFKIPVYSGDKISPAPPIKPVYKVKNTKKSNLFYTIDSDEAAALYMIEASEKITEVCVDPVKIQALSEGNKPYYDVDSFDPETGILKLKPMLLTKSNYNKINKKVTLDITFEEYGQVSYKLTVPVINKAPSVKIGGATLYNGAFSGSLVLTHSGLPKDTAVSVNGTNLAASLNGDKSAVDIVADGPFKGGSRKITFSSDAWRAPVKKTVNIKYIKNPASVMSFKASGKIKASDTAGTYLRYTPVMSSFPYLTVDDAVICDDPSDMFTVEFIQKDGILPNGKAVTGRGGAIILRAKENAGLIPGSKYKIRIESGLSNGLKIVKTVTVKPTK